MWASELPEDGLSVRCGGRMVAFSSCLWVSVSWWSVSCRSDTARPFYLTLKTSGPLRRVRSPWGQSLFWGVFDLGRVSFCSRPFLLWICQLTPDFNPIIFLYYRNMNGFLCVFKAANKCGLSTGELQIELKFVFRKKETGNSASLVSDPSLQHVSHHKYPLVPFCWCNRRQMTPEKLPWVSCSAARI